MTEVTYRPNQRSRLSYFETWKRMAGAFRKNRELITQLFRRDFVGSYKKSLLGPTWVFLSPIVGVVAWVFLRRAGMLNTGELDIPYPIYVLVGTTMWGLFMGFYSASASTLRAAGSLLMQINFPHEVYLFEQNALQLVNFSILLVLNLLAMIIFGVTPSWKLILLPLVLLPLFLAGAAIGLIASVFGAVTVDVRRGLDLTLGMMIWLSPIIYSSKIQSSTLITISGYNPLTYLVCSARDIVLYGRLYDTGGYLLSSLLALVLFLYACRVFYVAETRLVERMLV